MASLEVELREHTIKFDPKLPIDGMMVGIAGGGLRGFYQLNHIHLHWSNSEHTIDDNTYKMEVHLVHFKAPYDNLTVDDVIDEPDGIAVLSVLYELGGVDRVIHNLIENLRRNVTEAELPFIKPKDFLPETTDEYIRYRGSLTTPPCTEVVVWTVFPKPKTITQYQINWLRAKRLSAGTAQPDNFRVRQPVNDRQVSYMEVSYAYANPELPRASGKIVLPTLWLLGTWPVLVRLLGA